MDKTGEGITEVVGPNNGLLGVVGRGRRERRGAGWWMLTKETQQRADDDLGGGTRGNRSRKQCYSSPSWIKRPYQ